MSKGMPISGRVPPDSYGEFEKFREEYHLNKSEALRRLLKSGLKKKEVEMKSAKIDWGDYLRKAALAVGLIHFGMAISFVDIFMPLPQWAVALAGIMVLIGAGGIPFVFHQIPQIEVDPCE